MNISRWAWLAIPCALIAYCATPCLTESCKVKKAAAALEEFKDQEYERRNHIQQGEKYPQNYDYSKYAMIKIANRFLMWPSQHGSDRAIAFFWPSRMPAITSPQPQPKNEGQITVFFTDMYPYQHGKPVELYKRLMEAKKNKQVLSWKTVRKGLDKVSLKNDITWYYIATQYKDYQGYPPIVGCLYPDNNFNSLSSYSDDVWNGIKITFRFSSRYCQDWPEIYQYGMSVIINNVKEVQP